MDHSRVARTLSRALAPRLFIVAGPSPALTSRPAVRVPPSRFGSVPNRLLSARLFATTVRLAFGTPTQKPLLGMRLSTNIHRPSKLGLCLVRLCAKMGPFPILPRSTKSCINPTFGSYHAVCRPHPHLDPYQMCLVSLSLGPQPKLTGASLGCSPPPAKVNLV